MTKFIVVLVILRKSLKIRCKIQKRYRNKYFQYNTKKTLLFLDIINLVNYISYHIYCRSMIDYKYVFMLRHNSYRNLLISSSSTTHTLPKFSHISTIVLASL
jgi:hypothetical protein